MIARLDDNLRDARTIRKLRIEVEQLRQQLAGIQLEKLRPAPRAHHKPMTLTWDEAAAFAFRRSETWLRRNIAIQSRIERPNATSRLPVRTAWVWRYNRIILARAPYGTPYTTTLSRDFIRPPAASPADVGHQPCR